MAQQQRRQQDPVIGLISGRMVQRRDEEGKLTSMFQPFKINPNPTLSEVRKRSGLGFSEDEILIYERLRHNKIEIDRSVFVKSSAEKAKLKLAKKEHKSTLVKAGFNPSQRLNISWPMCLGSFRALKAL